MSEDHYFSAQPASADERRTIPVVLAGTELTLETAAGVFSPGHVDLGTQVLLRSVPEPHGSVLDLGCGWGPIALTAALRAPEAAVTAVDVNERALDLLRRNATRAAAVAPLAPLTAARADEVDPEVRFDVIWSNPPIRIGKDALHDLLDMWLPRLAPGGSAWLVVQRNLGADSLAKWLTVRGEQTGGWGAVEKVASAKGFRVLRVDAR
ncbi:class I SAM-dependent methyltransferase [Demequina zhanjiangensis]|uniref:Methyltransferase n=1 Tax=Demequina zhanjiangensis TaxID=3051659 RepID=A0ABT8G3C7_9MICO|nr:methyltransferase [Demequina sp. SYSU T00b26]MDN4473646.1 methyltransferase [Demequina sp. SYSU T00b26]